MQLLREESTAKKSHGPASTVTGGQVKRNGQLYDLLDGIQNGTVKFQVSRESDEEGSGSFVFTEENKEEYQNGEMEENE